MAQRGTAADYSSALQSRGSPRLIRRREDPPLRCRTKCIMALSASYLEIEAVARVDGK